MSDLRRRKVSSGSDQERKTKTSEVYKAKSTVVVLELSSVLCIVFGVLIGSLLCGPWIHDIVGYCLGYRWDFVNKCIMESPNENGYGTDFCRIPVDCDICKDVHKIDEIHVSELSVQLFEERYAYSDRPLVVRNATLDWKAMDTLNYYWFKEQYLSDPEILSYKHEDCWFNKYGTKEFRNLASVFRLNEDRIKLKDNKPWYVGWAVCHTDVANNLYSLYSRPSFINPDSTPPSKPWIFIGSPGHGANIHIDNVDLSSWQAQITGIKKWFIQPPPECSRKCGNTMEITVYPGDIIVLNTNVWFHGTLVLGSQLSLVLTNEYD
ncbi:bifunctional arginine demethylase and lysyl-hydroxylase JMJD6 isoform X2 [Eurytemora carolleeae]|uniref:bifunctional arginine demethylase and lysyl-hydroxylase JMJD6 isoform X2 n=1 Tax=Eurytemora carolleeae TaxID=1294199 RepID=UPI000C77FF59|nr:bifunctional arginine demethylase and lysyl-hydroxylase JMJD6 isoform X2 [Eurytemora carolleeae]|eukprot:XP_023337908.1 bifunctional arginine demethylase and lysyl-hydroxylase JMJD6-like isoform X2 [Eurytemora affinis]